MALSDLAVYSEYAYSAMTEVIDQQVELFNGQSRGTVTLMPTSYQGDYSDVAFWKAISNVVRRRNAYGTGSAPAATMENIVDTMVKVASGTPEITIPRSALNWTKQRFEDAGAAMGQQIAVARMQDMLNTGIMSAIAAISANADTTFDYSGTGTMTAGVMNSGAAKFGDRQSAITAWLMHSKPLNDYFANNLTNTNRLFVFGNVIIYADAANRPIIVSDCPAMLNATPDPDEYTSLGLVPGGIVIGQNDDWLDNFDTNNGDENISTTYQAEWSYQLGLKGFAWDKSSGGASPNDTALATAANWDQYVTSIKDTAGVAVITQ